MFAQQISQWFSAGARQEEVKIMVGAVLRKNLRGNNIEIAEVIEIFPDSTGVRHVRFIVSIQSADRRFREQRILGLAAFSEMFPIGCDAVEKGLSRPQHERRSLVPGKGGCPQPPAKSV